MNKYIKSISLLFDNVKLLHKYNSLELKHEILKEQFKELCVKKELLEQKVKKLKGRENVTFEKGE